MKNLRPLHNNVVLEPLEAEEKTTVFVKQPTPVKKKSPATKLAPAL